MCPRRKISTTPEKKATKTRTTVLNKNDIVRVVKGKYRNKVGRVVKVTEKTVFFRYAADDGEEVEIRKNKTGVEKTNPSYKRDILYYFGKQNGRGIKNAEKQKRSAVEEDGSDLKRYKNK